MQTTMDTLGDGNAFVRWRVVPGRGDGRQGLLRTGLLTPYLTELMAADGFRAGRGARLEVFVPPGTAEVGLAQMLERLVSVASCGVRVTVLRDGWERPRLEPDAA